jgi:2-keto-4-pentenoate hydratase/2-oxohepta-3-ene-1,7-dioic acid hydratase in catechol pathway
MSLEFIVNNQVVHPYRVFCIGRNYGEHVKELQNEIPREPVVFMKPIPSLVAEGHTLHIPPYGKELQHEVEVVLLITRPGKFIPEERATEHIGGITLGLDLTLRDVQNELRREGLPWELCKGFDQSAPLGAFVPRAVSMNLRNIPFSCSVNGVVRQRANTGEMLFPIATIIRYLSGWWELKPGDIVFTGTPSGIGLLRSGDKITIESERIGRFSWQFA